MARILSKYGFDLKPPKSKDEYDPDQTLFLLKGQPTKAEFKKEWIELNRLVREQKDTKFLVMFLFAGHGFVKQGRQILVTNEYDENTKFYNTIQAELLIRTFSSRYKNVYNVTIFACCRCFLDPLKFTDFPSKKALDEMTKKFESDNYLQFLPLIMAVKLRVEATKEAIKQEERAQEIAEAQEKNRRRGTEIAAFKSQNLAMPPPETNEANKKVSFKEQYILDQ